MSLLVVGSVAIDNVETPVERRDDLLGGSATHFSYAASFFTPVRLVGVVGDDFPAEHVELLESRNVSTKGLERKAGGRTFRWTGRYLDNMNDRETLDVQLNVFGEFDPVVPEEHRDARYVFLANGVPAVQAKVLSQALDRKIVVADTMDLWINEHRKDLDALIGELDGLVLNDSEAKLLTGQQNLVSAGHAVLDMGPRFVIVKKGEHGAMFIGRDLVGAIEVFTLPAFPTENVVDPTGAGDSFAGGMMGYLAEQDAVDPATLKTAMAYGTVVASFNVEGFGLHRMTEVTREQIDERLEAYKRMLAF
ncbi:PfkB family carbohydrate kinase [Botrimarina mediterranea]|uniref:Putative sugar kinase YdjH n=1 Tax=Botrimarina mediterranea TaxID=2528022 RepID=A0A518K6P3_9BACT|nr:PfkB family carbohydrate kinase [Botrimarina mediterranea]QDV73454.1 putative sugar kinase YdjH [Botrimarina mediterranea]QDV77971.1 putative sugar kinase YdjH [Planctomycetes bacterium K2D]